MQDTNRLNPVNSNDYNKSKLKPVQKIINLSNNHDSTVFSIHSYINTDQ
jgi:hypothetical protein